MRPHEVRKSEAVDEKGDVGGLSRRVGGVSYGPCGR